ncbi:hypothetical protein PGB34_11620 [Xenophilus arseniciresistens]|uniref:Uncharacterized protein n=1 Tax=Xenophilus arseniciresistens TaxID=1283306 RepID=A0AAE3N8F7_9BURK|nr:hypothetical protein [Xenophilus arseniciresistens]MDA7417016.1 hypothetical protein [Xenophilus arseniciresistens]
MPTLSNPNLRITLISGTSKAKVDATVRVNFDAFEEALIKQLGLKFRLGCRIWGEDSGLTGADDSLFSIASQTVTADGNFAFSRTVDRDSLDEDWVGNDEIYARFSCQSTTPSFPLAASVRSAAVTGDF